MGMLQIGQMGQASAAHNAATASSSKYNATDNGQTVGMIPLSPVHRHTLR